MLRPPSPSAFALLGVLVSVALLGASSPAAAGGKKVEGRAYLLTGDEKLKFKTGELGKTVDPGFQMVVAFPPGDPGSFLLQEFEIPDEGEEPDDDPPPTLEGSYVLDKKKRRVRFAFGASSAVQEEQLRDFIDEEVFGEDVEGDVAIDEWISSKWVARLDRKFKKLQLEGKVKLRASSESRGESWVVVYKLDLRGARVPLDILE
ncbi:MAG: hypothetical protein ACQGVK_20490 [Myxococcota bacterium]